jgi:hypothetical protein
VRDSGDINERWRAMAYWTKTEEEPNVYHIYDDCSEGEKILPENREEGSIPPFGRAFCEVCAKKRGY